jgi:membrane-associated phospholipid phosphatase
LNISNKEITTPYKLFTEDKIALSFSLITLLIFSYYVITGTIRDYNSYVILIISIIVLLAVIRLQNRSNSKLLKFIRSYIHIPLYGILFSTFQIFLHRLNPSDYDRLLLELDLLIFRTDFTVWFEKFISKPVTEILTLSYFSYYILPTVTFAVLFFLKNDNGFNITRKYLLSIITAWYAAFIFYLALPAAGPDIAFPEHYSIKLEGLSVLTNTYLENLSKYLKESNVRNTFPSLHFGILLIINYFAFRYKRMYFYVCTLPLGILLAIATIYLRQHYLIDLAGSIPLVIISIKFSENIIKKEY